MMAQRHMQESSATTFDLSPQWLVVARSIWGLLTVIALGLSIAGYRLRYQFLFEQAQLYPGLPLSPAYYAGWYMVLATLFLVVFSAVGIFIMLRQGDWITIFMSMMLIMLGVDSSNILHVLRVEMPALALLCNLILSLSVGLSTIAIYIFPNGQTSPRWMRWVAFFYLGWTLIRPFLYGTPAYPDQWPAWFFFLWMLCFLGPGTYSQIYRYQHTHDPARRQQTKWVVFGIVLAAVSFLLLLMVQALVPPLQQTGTQLSVLWELVEYTIYTMAFMPIPIVIAISILRYRLWDIDLVINRSLVYGALTAALGLVFALSVILLQQIARLLLGEQQTPLVLAIAMLVVGLLFQPTRRQVQRFVDRHLYGIEIDYEKIGQKQKEGRDYRPSAGSYETIGEYSGLKLIGRGGMAEVYRGRHPTLNNVVAVKIMPRQLSEQDYFRKRFEREARTVAALKHPNIVHMYDYGVEETIPYMVMEYIGGPSLGTYIQEKRQVPLSETVTILEDLASALDYAHAQGIVHRDIKPANVILEPATSPQGKPFRVVLMDFGIAHVESEERLTSATGLVGTFDYISPEQIHNPTQVDWRADIYSLGALTYEMLTGWPPFENRGPAAILLAHLNQPAPDPRQRIPDLPPHTAAAIMQALSKHPEGRQASASDFVRALAS